MLRTPANLLRNRWTSDQPTGARAAKKETAPPGSYIAYRTAPETSVDPAAVSWQAEQTCMLPSEKSARLADAGSQLTGLADKSLKARMAEVTVALHKLATAA